MQNCHLQLILGFLAGWVSRSQQNVIEYLQTENQVYRELLGKKRPRFNEEQRRRLAVKAKILGRKVLSGLGCIVTPDTLLRWYRNLIAKKYDGSKNRKPGRPQTCASCPKFDPGYRRGFGVQVSCRATKDM